MSVNFDYYKVFYYVAKYENITLAAKALFLSQPTVSHYIKNLENELNCVLFLRSKKGVTLTPEAKLLYTHIKKACEHIFEAEEELSSYQSMENGLLRIGASEMTLHNFLLPYLEKFRMNYPSIKLKITNNTTPTSISMIKAGLLDFSIITSPIAPDKDILVIELTTFQDIVIAGKQYAHLQSTPVHLKELTSYPLICLEQNTTTRNYLEDFFLRHQLTLDADIELATSDLIVPMVAHNLGIGFVPEGFAQDKIKEEAIYQVPLIEKLPPRHICLVCNANYPLPIAGNAFLKLLSLNPEVLFS